MDYDTALVTTAAEVANLTGRQGASNLENAGFTLATFLLNAHRWVYRRLEERGIDPTALSNQARLGSAEAMYAISLLVAGGHLDAIEGADATFYMEAARREVDEFVPAYSETTARGRTAGEALPMVGTFEEGIWHQGTGPGQVRYPRVTPRRL